MKKSSGRNIVIIGCGNVAWHLAKQFQSLKAYSVFVYNHQTNDALNAFHSVLKCKVAVGLENVMPDADFYFICVSDKYISEAASKLEIKNSNAVLLHTSGSTKLNALGKRLHNRAVFYPLQTFSKNDAVNWAEVPVIIETSNPGLQATVRHLARQITKTIKVLSYKERLALHLAAVMVNNFTNALYVAASEIVNESKEDLTILLPLIKQTTAKLDRLSPQVAQTGPAKRNDSVVLKKHLGLLSRQPELKKLYKQLSKLIIHQQKHSHA